MKRNWESILTMVVLGSLFIFSFYKFNQIITKQMGYQVEVSLEDVSAQNIVNIQREVKENFKGLRDISEKFQDFTNLTKEEIKEKVESIIDWGNYDFEYVGIANQGGGAYRSDGITKSIQDKKFFQKSIQGKEYISNTIRGVNIYSVPIYNEDSIIGVIFAAYDTNNLEQLLTIESFHKEGYMYILDEEGDVIVHSEKSSIYTGDNFFKSLFEEEENLNSCNQMKQDLQNSSQGSI